MGEILSKKTHDFNQELHLTAAVAADLTDKTDLTDISFKAGFQSLSLDTVIEITDLPPERKEEAMQMTIECKEHTWKDKTLSQAFQDYFTITSKLLLWRTENKEQNDDEIMKNALGVFIQKSQSLEQQLRDHYWHYTKILPKKRKYRILQFVAGILAIIPVIGPLNVSLIGGTLVPSISGLLSVGFVVIGGIGSTAVWFCKRKENALGVQEEVIGPVLMSMAFRNKDLNRINHLLNEGLSMQNHEFYVIICNFEERLRKERNLIQQKLSEQQESASPGWSIRPIEWGADNLNSQRSMYQ